MSKRSPTRCRHPLHRTPDRHVSHRPDRSPPRITVTPGTPPPRHPATRITTLTPEAEPTHLRQRPLQNQRGAVVAHAVRRATDAVICRLRFRLEAAIRTW
ncbi:hypothetical protein DY245_11255 [Streptomyces inhibens]|uniref:Uncharacterized protein n=1 Tax=Streptomyces inhibens TaxID=2293571 RepID=A0A371Q6I3_STRIH|nr:hypothetical protein DY245_11255 [Streptomyces inhibens]